MTVWPLVPWGWPLTTISGLSAAAEVWGSHGDCGARPDNFKPIKIWVVNLSRANRINVEWLGWAPTLSVHLTSDVQHAGPGRPVIRPGLHRASKWTSAANQRRWVKWLWPMRFLVTSLWALEDRRDWKENVNCAQDAATWVYVNLLKTLMASGLLCTRLVLQAAKGVPPFLIETK